MELSVRLGHEVVGRLQQNVDGLSFDYLGDYEGPPLSLSLLDSGQKIKGQALDHWLAGLLPDNPRVVDRWAREQRVSPDPFSLLSTTIGRDCPGAVSFHTTSGPFASVESGLTPLSPGEVGQRIAALRGDVSRWHSGLGRFSLAGAQPKLALRAEVDDDGELRWCDATGDEPTTHILKPGIDGLVDSDLLEHLTLSIARRIGLPAAASFMFADGRERAVVITRFDRSRLAGGGVSRRHMEDMCQALGLAPNAKYAGSGGPSIADIAALLPTADDLRSFGRALLFNWIIGGTDAHAKNYAVMLEPATRFAPLYDIASFLPYTDDLSSERLSLWLGEAQTFGEADRRDTSAAIADALALPSDAVAEDARRMLTHLPAAIVQICTDPAVAAFDSPVPQLLLTRLSERIDELGRIHLG